MSDPDTAGRTRRARDSRVAPARLHVNMPVRPDRARLFNLDFVYRAYGAPTTAVCFRTPHSHCPEPLKRRTMASASFSPAFPVAHPDKWASHAALDDNLVKCRVASYQRLSAPDGGQTVSCLTGKSSLIRVLGLGREAEGSPRGTGVRRTTYMQRDMDCVTYQERKDVAPAARTRRYCIRPAQWLLDARSFPYHPDTRWHVRALDLYPATAPPGDAHVEMARTEVIASLTKESETAWPRPT